MPRIVTKKEAVKSLRITAKNHKALSHLAIDQNANLMEVADKVIAAGIRAVKQSPALAATAPSN
jgi:hypothetical protein